MKAGWYRYKAHEVGYDVYDPEFIFQFILEGVDYVQPEVIEGYLSACVLMYPASSRTLLSVVKKVCPEYLEHLEKLLVLI